MFLCRFLPSGRGFPLLLVVLLLFLLSEGTPARGGTNLHILSAPGHPISILLDERDGLIRSAYLRSPAGTEPLDSLKGHRLVRDHRSTPYIDADWKPDLLWQLSFARDDAKKGVDLWIAYLSGRPRLWVAESPTAATLWDSLSINIDIPEGTALYVSPSLPRYSDEEPTREGRTLSFIYTVGLTPDGPGFTIVPAIYRQLQEITLLVAQAEGDEVLRRGYDSLAKDFGTMSKGQHPSAEALSSFTWKKLLYREWPW